MAKFSHQIGCGTDQVVIELGQVHTDWLQSRFLDCITPTNPILAMPI
jgi:hypothetical protein